MDVLAGKLSECKGGVCCVKMLDADMCGFDLATKPLPIIYFQMCQAR